MSVSHFLVLGVLIGVAAGLPSVSHLRATAEGERARLEAERIRKDTADDVWLNRTLAYGGIQTLSFIMLRRMLTGAEERARQGECTTMHYDIPEKWSQRMNLEMETQFLASLESIAKEVGFFLSFDYTPIMTTTADGPDRSSIHVNNIKRYRVGWCK